MSGEQAGSGDGNVTAMLLTISFVFVLLTGEVSHQADFVRVESSRGQVQIG